MPLPTLVTSNIVDNVIVLLVVVNNKPVPAIRVF